MERSLLYVSRRSPCMLHPEREIEEIVASSRVRNAQQGITGAMACTQDHFAQLLEGPAHQLDDLMHRIERDQRHVEVTILKTEPIIRRRLPDWSMAYSGQSTYVARQIAPLIGVNMQENSPRIERLMTLLVGLATPDPVTNEAN